MTVASVKHATFDVERDYQVDSAELFRAWATPSLKRRWFAPDDEHELDFTVGGREIIHARRDGRLLTMALTSSHRRTGPPAPAARSNSSSATPKPRCDP